MNTPPDLNAAVTDYLARLRVERRASAHTLDAYGRDLGVLLDWMVNQGITSWPALTAEALRAFIARSEEHTSELQSLMRISYAVFCLKKKTQKQTPTHI